MDEVEMEVDEEICTPPEIDGVAEAASLGLLPEESREPYERAYKEFLKWKELHGAHSFSERTLQAYFEHLFSVKEYKPSIMWSVYSMLNLTIRVYQDVDISKHRKVIAYLKRKYTGYTPVRAKMISESQIEKFLKEAPDHTYLATKVALVFGTAGAMRSAEFPRVVLADIEEMNDNKLFVTIPITKTKKPRSFIIAGGLYDIVKRYQRLRPAGTSTDSSKDRFFLTYRNGVCTRSPIGINKFRQMTKEIAKYLQLPNPERYTSHTSRRSGTNTLANSGKADNFRLRAYGKWASVKTADSYIEETENFKDETSTIILGALNLPGSTDAPSPGRNLPSTNSVIIPAPSTSTSNICPTGATVTVPSASTSNICPTGAIMPALTASPSNTFPTDAIMPAPSASTIVSVEEELFTQEVIQEFSNDIVTNSSSAHVENIMKHFTMNNCSNITFNFR